MPDDLPDAEPTKYAIECAVCDDRSSLDTSRDLAQKWAFSHLRTNPEHFTYRQIVQQPLRFEPGAWR